MPSSTFFRLPDPKRNALLRCAREEFARVSYPEASINRIIHAAGIPRGSFYMYFTDKADLFSYLVEQHAQHLSNIMVEQLKAYDGDLFVAFHAIFDYVQHNYHEHAHKDALAEILSILRLNKGLPHNVAQQCAEQVQKDILAHLDLCTLHIEQERDVEDILYILLHIIIPLICKGLMSEDPSATKAQYHNVLDILKRGMASQPTAAARQS